MHKTVNAAVIGTAGSRVIVPGANVNVDTGWFGYSPSGLPNGLKYNKTTGAITGAVGASVKLGEYVVKFTTGMNFDAKNGNVITGVPTKPGEYTVQVKVTSNSGAVETRDIKILVSAMPETAVGTFNGFVGTGDEDKDGVPDSFVGSFALTATDAGKLTAKVITAAGTVSFSGAGWDSVAEGVYHAKLTTKKGEVLWLNLDSKAAWDGNQLTGTYVSAVPAKSYMMSAQRNAFGKTWYFTATGNESDGWKFAFTSDAKSAALTVTLKADGSTSIAGKLLNGTDANNKALTISVSASGYANVSGMREGAILSGFAPVLTVNKVKKVLAIKVNLWFDRANDYVGKRDVGAAQFVE